MMMPMAAVSLGRGDEDLAQVLQADFLVDDHSQHKGIRHGHGGRLGGGELPGPDAAQQDDRGEHGQKSMGEPFDEFPKTREGGAGVIVAPGVEGHHDHQGDGHHQAGDHPAQEEPAHGDLGHQPEDDHGDAGREDGADGRGGGGDGDAEVVVVAFVPHGLQFHLAEAGRVGHGRAGHAGEDQAGHDVGVSQAAGQEADQQAGEVEEPGGDAGGVHQLGGQDEQGDGQEQEVVDSVLHPLGQHGDVHPAAHLVEVGQQAGHAQRVAHRYAQHEEDDHPGGDDEGSHGVNLRSVGPADAEAAGEKGADHVEQKVIEGQYSADHQAQIEVG